MSHVNANSDGANIVVTICTGILFIIVSVVYLFCCWNIIKGLIKKTIIRSNVIIGSFITLTLFFIAVLSLFVYSITTLSDNPSFGVRSIGSAAYIFGQEAMLYTFILRIDFIFNNSVLQISKRTSKSLRFSWLFNMICGFVVLVFNMTISGVGGEIVISLLAVLWILSYLSLSIVLITLFIYKIRNLIILSSQMSSANDISVSTATNLNKSNQITMDIMLDMELLYIVIKNGILVPIAITSSIIFTILALTFRVLPQFDYPQTLVIDITVTTLCIFLLFKFNTLVYNNICWRAHNKCQKWWIPSIENSKSMMDLQSRHRVQSQTQQQSDNTTKTITTDYNMDLIVINDNINTTPAVNVTQPTYNLNVTNNASNPINKTRLSPLTIDSRAYAVSNPLVMKGATMDNTSQLKSILIDQIQSDPLEKGKQNLPKLKIAQSNFV